MRKKLVVELTVVLGLTLLALGAWMIVEKSKMSSLGGDVWRQEQKKDDEAQSYVSKAENKSAGQGERLKLTEDNISVQAFNNTVFTDIALLNNRIFAAGERGIVVSSGDGGNTWQKAEIPTDLTMTAISGKGDKLWVVGEKKTIFFSRDGGLSWQLVNSSMEPATLMDVWIGDDLKHGIAVGTFGTVLRTVDGGRSWHELRTFITKDGDNPNLYGIAEWNRELFVVGEYGFMVRSADFGESWSPIAAPYQGTFFGVLPVSNGLVTFGFLGNTWRFEPNESRWSAVAVDWGSHLFGGFVLDEQVVLVGSLGLVVESLDGGMKFFKRRTGVTIPLTGVVNYDGSFIAISPKGFWKFDTQLARIK